MVICKPNAACTGWCASRRLTQINGDTPRLRAWMLWLKSGTLRRLKLIRRILRSAHFAAGVKADRTSTRWKLRCEFCINRPELLWPVRPSAARDATAIWRSEEHTSELQSLAYLVCRLLLEKK